MLDAGPGLERFAEPDAFVPFRLVLPWWVRADMASGGGETLPV